MDEFTVDAASEWAVIQEERAQVGVRAPSLEEMAAGALRRLFVVDCDLAGYLARIVIGLRDRRGVIESFQRMGVDHEDEQLRALEEAYLWLRLDVAKLVDKVEAA